MPHVKIFAFCVFVLIGSSAFAQNKLPHGDDDRTVRTLLMIFQNQIELASGAMMVETPAVSISENQHSDEYPREPAWPVDSPMPSYFSAYPKYNVQIYRRFLEGAPMSTLQYVAVLQVCRIHLLHLQDVLLRAVGGRGTYLHGATKDVIENVGVKHNPYLCAYRYLGPNRYRESVQFMHAWDPNFQDFDAKNLPAHGIVEK